MGLNLGKTPFANSYLLPSKILTPTKSPSNVPQTPHRVNNDFYGRCNDFFSTPFDFRELGFWSFTAYKDIKKEQVNNC